MKSSLRGIVGDIDADMAFAMGLVTLATTSAVSGVASVRHGLGMRPRAILATPVSSGVISANVQGVTDDQFQVAFFYVDGAARTTSNPCYWLAVA